MTLATQSPSLWSPEFEIETRPDGTIVMQQTGALPSAERSIPDSLVKWAKATPEATFIAQRGDDGDWRRVSYATALGYVRALGTGMLQLGLGPDRPLLILSENSIEHAMLGLAAQYVGVPYAPLSTAYSLVSTDHGKLKDIARLLRPGLVFATDGQAYAAALQSIADLGHTALNVRNPAKGALLYDDLLATPPGPNADAAFAALTGDTVGKYLFTSGSTGSPKAVINSQAMMTSNQTLIADCYRFVMDRPPVVVDWAPWNHTAAGNKVFNMVLTNGGTYYIDEGKPTPALIGKTIRNLKDISPTWYFNVPAGYDMLVEAMKSDDALRQSFFKDLDMMMYAGAGMAQHTWDDLLRLSCETVGHEVLLATGLGSTETGPFALMCTDRQTKAGNVGVPALGITLKLVPNGDKLEARLKSPSITPGYLGDPDKTAEMLDDEGYYCIGDALRPADPDDLTKGFFFDGRTAENFKLGTGTWVAVGALRASMIDHFGGLIRDAVIVGEGREHLGAILIAQNLADVGTANNREALQDRLNSFAKQASGSSNRVMRAIVIDTPPDIDKGEVTDKGSINQRAVISNRPDLVETLFSDAPTVLHATR